jgi:hypothetical protein
LGRRRNVKGVDTLCVPARPARRRFRLDQLGRERASIEAGIELVASGSARRVVLCGLRFAERLLTNAVLLADAAGVSLRLDRVGRGSLTIEVTAARQPPAA